MGAGCQFRMPNHNLTSNSFAPPHLPHEKSAFPGPILFYFMKVSPYLIHKTVLLMQERKTEKPVTLKNHCFVRFATDSPDSVPRAD